MYCSHCGKKVGEDMLFCPFCGKPIVIPEQDDAPETPTVADVPAVPVEEEPVNAESTAEPETIGVEEADASNEPTSVLIDDKKPEAATL